MDWKQILGLSVEDLQDSEKDQLSTDLAWFDYESEELDETKYVALLKLSQEILKYKNEQVEILLSELDQLAVRQGEEEAKKGSSDDMHSPKSRKTASPDYDDIEIKYGEMKAKFKQQIKVNSKQRHEIEKLQRKVEILEQEKVQLQDELQSVSKNGDESSSEVSESVADRHKEIINTLHHRNQQISNLLNDIEAVECENITLRENIVTLKNELSDASNQLTLITEEFTELQQTAENNSELIATLKEENARFQTQIENLNIEINAQKKQIEEFDLKILEKENNYKVIIETKNQEIKQLQQLQSGNASIADEEPIKSETNCYIQSLKELLNEREHKMAELKSQLQNATIEMDESTKLLQSLGRQNNANKNGLKESSSLIRDLKAQIKSAHDRCQALQADLEFTEKLLEEKTASLKDITNQLKQDGFGELADLLNKNDQLKFRLTLTEKDLAQHVKITNKLQEARNHLENENLALREKCGLSTEEQVDIRGVILTKRKENRELKKLENKIEKLENEKLNFQLEIRKLNRRISVLSEQIFSLGEKPNIEVPEPEINTTDDGDREKAYIAVIEENEALRKGLHEILSNIHERNDSHDKEIESETLSKLLKALDQRHIAGWYHPAMRLQAELHELQGINIELRAQLKTARNDFKLSENISEQLMLPCNQSEIYIGQNINSKLLNDLQLALKETKEKDVEIEQLQKLLDEWGNRYKIAEQQISLLYTQHQMEKSQWETDQENYEDFKKQSQLQMTFLEVKLDELLKCDNPHYRNNEKFADTCAQVIILNRKVVFLEHENQRLTQEFRRTREELFQAEVAVRNKIAQLNVTNQILTTQNVQLEKILNDNISGERCRNAQNDFDALTLKYRELLTQITDLRDGFSNEISVLNQNVETLETQKAELRTRLLETLSNKHTLEISATTSKEEILSRQLAQSEINELAEKQRANHMSNLYEVVKEQLQKSEERFKELELYNKNILHKNLFLQESFVKIEDNKINSVDLNVHNKLQENFAVTLQEMENLRKENYNLKHQLDCISSHKDHKTYVTNESDSDILNLKHQILDLQSESDDKALIARLSSDVIYARIAESDCKKRYEIIEKELSSVEEESSKYRKLFDQEKLNNDNLAIAYQNRICLLEDIIRHQRQRYLGSLPLVLQQGFVAIVKKCLEDKHAAFLHRQHVQKEEHDVAVLKDELKQKLQMKSADSHNIPWHLERNALQMKELKMSREVEFKESQLQQLSQTLRDQEEMILKMQEELLHCNHEHDPLSGIETLDPKDVVSDTSKYLSLSESSPIILKQQTTQTSPNLLEDLLDTSNVSSMLVEMEKEMTFKDGKIVENEETIQGLKAKNMELEMNISLFRMQIGDRQSQIAFYEKHIMELQNKLNVDQVDNSTSCASNEIEDDLPNLKGAVSKLKDTIIEKEKIILNYETLIKECKDEHSLAASRMQEEVKQLQEALNAKTEINIEESAKALIEQYIQQVHALEQHADEMHTVNTAMTAQLKASRQEAVRWRGLASDRLQTMDEVRKEIERQHYEELELYKADSNKWREEVLNLKQLITKYKSGIKEVEPNFKQILKEKDDRIRELSLGLKNFQNNVKKLGERTDSNAIPKLKEAETAREVLVKENDALRKRLEEVVNREKSAKEEARDLREKLVKRPIPLKTDRSDKEIYQKKVAAAEKELEQLKEQLKQQTTLAQNHKEKVERDFEKWKKYKLWQETAEKLKHKVREQKACIDKQNATISCYKTIKERLEREKRTLENQVKTLKNPALSGDCDRLHIACKENEKLVYEVDRLSSELENQRKHAGGLGAALLQEKLEAQERKIAVLEMSSKGTCERRSEVERLQETSAHLQKTNLRLEAESLELKLDLEKYGKEVPHLREQILHLENYIEVLKQEQNSGHVVTGAGDQGQVSGNAKKVAELERTVLVLKRVVEKLQNENKRLQGGSRPCNTRTASAEKLRLDYLHLKDQYGESIQKVARLEEQLKAANRAKSLENKRIAEENATLSKELAHVKVELFQKNELLNKVKSTLQRAAFKEKSLQEEVNVLKQMLPSSGERGDCY